MVSHSSVSATIVASSSTVEIIVATSWLEVSLLQPTNECLLTITIVSVVPAGAVAMTESTLELLAMANQTS